MPNLKVLCFTTSYNRHKMLRGTINDIKNQSYNNIFHSINIALDINNQLDYSLIYNDILDDRCKIIYNSNQHQHINHINAIKSIDYNQYDVFVKIDDDDIYKKDYIKTIVDYFINNPNIDVISSKINLQLNGSIIRQINADNLGGNTEGCIFRMPPTFAFNKKALFEIINLSHIYGFEDHMWRDVWCKNCIIGEVDNSKNIIWNIHGQNISTADFLIK